MKQIKGRFTVPAEVGQIVWLPAKQGTNPFRYKVIKTNRKSVIIENVTYHTKFAVVLDEKANNYVYSPISSEEKK